MTKCAKCNIKLDLSDKNLKFVRHNSKRDFYCPICAVGIKGTEYKGRKIKVKR